MKAQKEILTPDGMMEASGYVRRFIAAITDFYFVFLLAGLVVILLTAVIPYVAAPWNALIVAVVLLAYFLLRRKRNLPSLGDWTLGLKRYTFEELDGYAGKGGVVCIEPLPAKIYTRRTLITAFVIGALLLSFFLYARLVDA